ncbi:Hypothetical predicted protein [Paramuricea clavata]|uniref:Uncharacterized protein n=1 Tax=Paramuricea clavata TaxID=317549 RepID=A0A6S7JFR4_PARCT|nr:Hypothetical predicted protein [Paramuricea clavata]
MLLEVYKPPSNEYYILTFLEAAFNEIVMVVVESLEEESTKDPATCDASHFDNIKDHAGWVVRRAGETLMKGYNKIPTKESVAESTLVYGDKAGALEIISALGKDVKQADEKF